MSDVDGQVKNEELDAQREARRRLALAQIRQYPDAALKMEARPVEQFDDELRRLVERMKRLMHDASGIGLAATQVGVLQRLFVFHPAEEEDNHELYLLCEDIEATAKELERRKIPITRPFHEERWGSVTRITLPGGGRIGLYQPKHPLAHAKTGATQSRT